MTLFELKKKLQEYFVKKRLKKNSKMAQSWVQPFISLHKGDGSSLSIVNDEKFVKNIIDKNKEILAHEREPFHQIGFKSGDAMKDFVLIELKMQILKKNWLFNSNQTLGYPRLHVFRRTFTIHQILIKIYEIMRPLLKDIPKIDSQIWTFSQFEDEYNFIFDKNHPERNEFYDVFIKNNIQIKSMKCEFCDQKHTDNCPLDFGKERNQTVNIDQILQMIQSDRELEIVIQWKQKCKADLAKVEDTKFQSVNLDGSGTGVSEDGSSKNEESKAKDPKTLNTETSIFDCLDRFQHEEMLSGNDKWYCPRCKDHVSALKKI